MLIVALSLVLSALGVPAGRLDFRDEHALEFLEPHSVITPTPAGEKIVFHEMGPWCQKGWKPLL